jgi:hypothetical protein
MRKKQGEGLRVRAERHSIAVGGNMTVTIHACELRQLLAKCLNSTAEPEELARVIVKQCLAHA